MATPLLLRAMPLLRLRLQRQRLTVGLFATPRRPCFTATEPTRPGDNLSTADNVTAARSATDPPKYHRLDDPDYRKWKDKEEEILQDIEPIILLTKEILHSERYLDGERLTVEDEKAVVERLLAYHPHSEDKIGCGLDSIMVIKHLHNKCQIIVPLAVLSDPVTESCLAVDRHPQFKRTRCLFVVRTDGGWIDFSYQKCLRAYIRDKYPSYAERFIQEHFKRGSG